MKIVDNALSETVESILSQIGIQSSRVLGKCQSLLLI